MKSFVKVAALGLSGVLVFKLVTGLVFPLFALLLIGVALAVKVALMAAVVYLVYSMLCKRRDGVEVHDRHEEAEIEIDI